MKKEIVLMQNPDWSQIEEVVQASVVQIFAQVGVFDWVEPYVPGEQVENRGSGFILNQDGYIVTNAHVVDEAKRIWVHVPWIGRQAIHVDIVGFCPDRDLALLRIRPDDLVAMKKAAQGDIPALVLGDSDTVKRTDNVMVLGYPLGQYRLKTSTGIVSGREASAGQAFIQMTAPLNPGSSGGPLLNELGQVVGITLALVPDAQNVGYAIAINELKQVLDRLYTQRLVKIPILGAQFIFASDSKAEYLGNPVPAGIYVSKILKDSLFERAGVLVGDMLYEFNGFQLDAYGDTDAPWGFDKASLTDLIARVKLGETVSIALYRRGERKEIHFTFEMVAEYPIRRMYPDYEPIDYEVLGGMVIMQLADNHFAELLAQAPDLFEYTRADHKVHPALVITYLLPGSMSHQLQSLLPGDIILYVNDERVTTLEAMRHALDKSISMGFVTIKTKRDIFAVFALDELLHDELQMSKDFLYPISKGIRHLIDRKK